MKYLMPFVLICSILLWGCSDNSHNSTQPITISVVEMSPNSFTADGEIVGVDVDVATAAMNAAGIDSTIEMETVGTDGYDKTLNGPNHALLGVGYSEERKDLFKWAGPTSKSGYYIISKVVTAIGSAIGLDGAKGLPSVAVVEGWLETTTLEDLGFDNLIYYPSYAEAVAAFLNDDVVAIASDGKQLAYEVQGQFVFADDFDICFSYKSVYYYMAFSKDVDDAIVAAVQDSIDDLVKNKQILTINQKYFPDATESMLPDLLQLFTEMAPPFNYYTGSIVDTNFEGSSIDIVEEIQERNGYASHVNLTGWLDGYDTVQYLPNSALFTTARTPEREDLFQWVGPIATLRASFYTMADSGITIANLEQAKTLGSIATPSNWYMHDYLLTNNFDNVVATSFSPVEAFNRLKNGEVDALFMYDSGIDWLCDTTSTPRANVVEQFEESRMDGYIAFSLNTPVAIVQQWQQNLDAMKDDGTFQTIWDTWYEGSEAP